MKLSILKSVLVLGLAAGVTAQAGIYTYNGSPYSIPDGTTVGASSQISVSGVLGSLSDITVALNVSGQYNNGDLYAYLSYSRVGGGSAVLVPLLDRVGVGTGNSFGYFDSGFNVTLSSSAANNIHFYQNYSPAYNGSGQLMGTWQPDGRTIDPALASSSPGSFDAPGTVSFSSFNGLNPNGTWTLFMSDLSSGGQSTMVSWSLGITAVPEPANVALGIFAGIFLLGMVGRSRPVRDRIHRWRAAVTRWIDAV